MLHATHKTVARTAVIGLALGAVSLALSAPALAAIPKVTVTPHTNLKGGQVVKVSVAHFPAKTAVTIIECNGNGDGDLSNCYQAREVKKTTSASGTLSNVSFKVKAGTVGNGTCGTSSADKFCYIAVLASDQMQATNISFKK